MAKRSSSNRLQRLAARSKIREHLFSLSDAEKDSLRAAVEGRNIFPLTKVIPGNFIHNCYKEVRGKKFEQEVATLFNSIKSQLPKKGGPNSVREFIKFNLLTAMGGQFLADIGFPKVRHPSRIFIQGIIAKEVLSNAEAQKALDVLLIATLNVLVKKGLLAEEQVQ